MKTFTIDWLNKCRCGNKSHTVKTARGNETALWDDDAVKCNSCGRGGVIQVCEGQARVLWETDEEMADGKPMTTITKERLLTIKQWRETYGPGSNVVLPAEEAEELARIALASLEADPVAYIFKHPAGKLFWALTDESNKDQSDVIPVYAAHPVPVVPAALPENDDEDGHDIDYLEPSEVYSLGRTVGWNACRAAMLHGAEPVSQTHKSQHTQFEQVADLYEMQFDDGRTCAFHTDAQKAAQWLQACDGNRVQEYVKLERLRNALSGNYPVTPDGWISCSEQMPVIGELNWRTSFPLLVTCEIGVIPAYYGFVSVNGDRHYGFMESLKYGDDNGNHPQTNEYGLISNVTHWMPLPEPPQEVNRG